MSAIETMTRPMSIGELLDRAITLYRRNFLTLVGIVAIVNIPYLIAQALVVVLALPNTLTGASSRTSNIFSNSFYIYALALMILAIPVLLAYILEQGALAAVTSEFLLGRRMGIREAYRRAFRRGWALFGAQFILGLLNLFIFGLLFAPFIGLALASSRLSSSSQDASIGILMLCVCIGFLPALALAAILNIHFIFWSQAIMIESRGVRSGLTRSWNLVRGSFWRVFLIATMTYIFIAIISATPTYAISFATLLLPSPIIGTILNSTISILISIFVTPLWFSLLTLLYYDFRIRKEGYDLEIKAQQMTEASQ